MSWTFYGLLKRQIPLAATESLAAETLVLALPAVALVGWGISQSDGVPASATPWHGSAASPSPASSPRSRS